MLLELEQLKAEGQDFEWYPTTDAIIDRVQFDVESHRYSRKWGKDFVSFLDIGAGNGKVLNRIKRSTYLTEMQAIEKSSILLAQLDKEVLVIGTDFREQSLVGKTADFTFCNPPYSEFEDWSEKIIRESSSRYVYLVIPERWKRSEKISAALKFRDVSARVLGTFDFLNAERRARATVDLLLIELPAEEDDSFSRLFEEQFHDLVEKFEENKGRTEDSPKGGSRRPFEDLKSGPDLPDRMVEMYRAEVDSVMNNYALVNQLDAGLLQELAVYPETIKKCLKERLATMRNEYWNELFRRITPITDRLTSGSRKRLLGTLTKHSQVDFTIGNICEIVLWVIKNANDYIDKQLIETYEVMVDACNVQLYKSNAKVWTEQDWRYIRSNEVKPTHFLLDFRIVCHRVGGVKANGGFVYDSGLAERAGEFLADLMTLARNLGFNCETNVDALATREGRKAWTSGEARTFYYTKEGNPVELFEVRGFNNGNLHIKLAKKFIMALNVEHGRLQGWLRSPKEASDEIGGDAASWFSTNKQITTTDIGRLLN